MNNLMFQPFLTDTVFNLLLSLVFIILILFTALKYPLKNKYCIGLLLVSGTIISFYANAQRVTDGYTIGLLVGLGLATFGAVSLGRINRTVF